MNKGLHRYLNDHLAGSEGALKIVDHLIKNTSPNAFFKGLKRTITADQKTLKDLMTSTGIEPCPMTQLAGNVTGSASRLKLKWDGDSLGAFEALEMLALGIQGKRLLWKILGEISGHFDQWRQFDFVRLEHDAAVQRNAVEALRCKSGKEALVCG